MIDTKRLNALILATFFVATYIISLFYLDGVEIRSGNIVPFVNFRALFALTLLGVVCGGLLVAKYNHSILPIFSETNKECNRRNIILLLAVLVLFRVFAYILSPEYIQFMRVWPDSVSYLSDMNVAMEDPRRIFDRKSSVYTLWLIFNHMIGGVIGIKGSDTYIGATFYFRDIAPAIYLQNVLGVVSAFICFKMFSKISVGLAYMVTLLVFLNPTTLAIENAILRETLALFFILGGFSLFLEIVERKKSIYSLASGSLFVLAYLTRPEMLAIYIMLFFILLIHGFYKKDQSLRLAIMFVLPMVISVLTFSYSSTNINKSYGGWFSRVAMFGLKSNCFFYESAKYPDLIKSIQKRVQQCRDERKSFCDNPAPSVFVLNTFIDEEIDRYIKENQSKDKNYSESLDHIRDGIYLDIARNNTLRFALSVAINVGYNLMHNIFDVTPIFYEGNNYWISKNWNYFASPKMLVLYENKAPPRMIDTLKRDAIIAFFRIIESHTTRKILFPFFFVGSLIIMEHTRKTYFADPTQKSLFLISMLLTTWIFLVFISIMGVPVSRYIYPLFQNIFAIEVIGLVGTYRWLRLFMPRPARI